MIYLDFAEEVKRCNWNPIVEVFLEHWESDGQGGKQCVRIPVTSIRFENGEVIIAGEPPTLNGKS